MENGKNIRCYEPEEMFLTKVRTTHGHWGKPKAVTLDTLADMICNRPVSPRLDNQQYLIFSSLFHQSGLHAFDRPTGMILVSAELSADSTEASMVRCRVQQMPQTIMTFTDYSRRKLRIVARCESADGMLPADSFAYLGFLRKAQQQVSRYYELMAGCRIPLEEESLTRGCRLCRDADVYVNAEATALTVIIGAEELSHSYPLAHTDRNGNFSSDPTAADLENERLNYYACVDRAWQESDTDSDLIVSDPIAQERFLVCLARLCRKSGLQEEASVQRTGNYHHWGISIEMVRKIFRSVYQKRPEGRLWSQMEEKERIAYKVRDFFNRRYELRFNVMRQVEEFRPKGIDYHPWQVLTERDINRIGQEQMLDCGATWPIGIKQYAQSSLSRDYNPVHEFLAGCGTWDKRRDYIGQLADRVPCQYKEWQQLFHRWFLGMVAQWLGKSRDYGNAVVPMLIGPQGCRKSTFCKLILPRSLREYYIDDLKLDSAEQAERVLGRMALVNIDEYNAKTDREQAKIKRLLTERDVQVRRMRSDQYLMVQRMASFIATTNERQPLTDSTGSRRYLCVEVTGTIDTMSPLNYQQLYAQAIYELDHGTPYWMSPEEERIMTEHNQLYASASTTEILLSSYYRPAPRCKDSFIKAVDILDDLQQRTRGSDRPNMMQLVKALKAQHYEYGAIDGVRGWYAVKV